jgi:phosphoribosylformimino-5-aminoimidazole carboxamide ribotide isomerase
VNQAQFQSDVAQHLIGVIDIRGGCAVHAIAGKRTHYQPAHADGIPAGDALKLAMRYRDLGVASLYIADLDAICDNSPNTHLLAELASCAERCLIDAGHCTTHLFRELAPQNGVHFVLPTESFESLDQWTIACQSVDCDRVVMGLDLNGAELRLRKSRVDTDSSGITSDSQEKKSDHWQNILPWVARADELNIAGLLVLDLAYVGTAQGPGCMENCRAIRSHYKDLPIISGGGIRTREDVMKMRNAGCDRLLVGTALHRDDSATRMFALD